MTEFLTGVKNFLQLISDNWTLIISIGALAYAIYKKASNFLALNKIQRVQVAKECIRESILKMVADAERNYYGWKSAGTIKRAEVIEKIFKEYPILSKVTDQAEIIGFIDELIDDALQKLKDIIEQQTAK